MNTIPANPVKSRKPLKFRKPVKPRFTNIPPQVHYVVFPPCFYCKSSAALLLVRLGVFVLHPIHCLSLSLELSCSNFSGQLAEKRGRTDGLLLSQETNWKCLTITNRSGTGRVRANLVPKQNQILFPVLSESPLCIPDQTETISCRDGRSLALCLFESPISKVLLLR